MPLLLAAASLLPAAPAIAAVDAPAGRWIVAFARADGSITGPARADGPLPARIGDPVARRTATRVARTLGIRPDRSYHRIFDGFTAPLTARSLAALRRDPSVASLVPDRPVRLAGEIASSSVRRTRLGDQVVPTGIRRARVGGSPWVRIDGRDEAIDADVAIVDTGIAPSADLRIAGGYDCTGPSPGAWRDRHGHGTHVAGTVGAKDDARGVVGAAPGVRLWAVKVIADDGSGLLSQELCGLETILGWRDGEDPERPRIEVANLSIGWTLPRHEDRDCGRETGDLVHAAICALVADGTTVVVAAGNQSVDARTRQPAAYDEAITVSALADFDGLPGGRGRQSEICPWYSPDQDDTFADFSNFGPEIDLIAPGKCILSTLPDGWYGWSSGTSMASPLVAGVAALVAAAEPGISPERIRRTLVAAAGLGWRTATDPDSVPDRLIDAGALGTLPELSISATTPADELAPGGIVESEVTLTRSGRHRDPVRVSVPGLPAGITAEVAGPAPGGSSARVTLHHDGSAAAGPLAVTIRAADGSLVRTTSITVQVRSGGLRGIFDDPAPGTPTITGAGPLSVALHELSPGAAASERRLRFQRADPPDPGSCVDAAWEDAGPVEDPEVLDPEGSPAGGWSIDQADPGSDGCYRWLLRLIEGDGESVRFVSGALLRDTVDPPAPLARATGSGVWQRSAGTIAWVRKGSGTMRIVLPADADPGAGIAQLAAEPPDPAEGWTLAAGAEDREVEIAWDPAAGRAELPLIAIDGAGRTSAPAILRLNVDGNAPTGGRWSWPPASGTTVTGFVPELRWGALVDAGSGVAPMQEIARQSAPPPRAGSCAGAAWAADGEPELAIVGHRVTDLRSGRCYRWLLTPRDRTGNAAPVIVSGALLPDLVAPTGRFRAPAPGTIVEQATGSFLVRWEDQERGGLGGAILRRLERERTPLAGQGCDPLGWRPVSRAVLGSGPVRARGLDAGYCYRWRLNLEDARGNTGAVLSGVVRIAPAG